jgi:hypothetical protein
MSRGADSPPALAGLAEGMVREGRPREEAIAAMVKAAEARPDELRDAKTWWVRRMPRLRWDDYTGVHVLAILEEALARVLPLIPATRR